MPESITRKVIETVREYPVIYDKHHPDSQNREKKAETWEEISGETHEEHKERRKKNVAT